MLSQRGARQHVVQQFATTSKIDVITGGHFVFNGQVFEYSGRTEGKYESRTPPLGGIAFDEARSQRLDQSRKIVKRLKGRTEESECALPRVKSTRIPLNPCQPLSPSCRIVSGGFSYPADVLFIVEKNVPEVHSSKGSVLRGILRLVKIEQVPGSICGRTDAEELQKRKPRGLLIPKTMTPEFLLQPHALSFAIGDRRCWRLGRWRVVQSSTAMWRSLATPVVSISSVVNVTSPSRVACPSLPWSSRIS